MKNEDAIRKKLALLNMSRDKDWFVMESKKSYLVLICVVHGVVSIFAMLSILFPVVMLITGHTQFWGHSVSIIILGLIILLIMPVSFIEYMKELYK